MKRIVSLLCALAIGALCALSAGASGVSPDGIVDEKDFLIDLNLTTTLIIVICSVLTVCVIAGVIVLARRNRHKPHEKG